MNLPPEDRMSELRQLFFESAAELVQTLNDQAMQLEKSPGNAEIARSLRRTVHTLKGDAAACGFRELSELAHEFEDVLRSKIRRRPLWCPKSPCVLPTFLRRCLRLTAPNEASQYSVVTGRHRPSGASWARRHLLRASRRKSESPPPTSAAGRHTSTGHHARPCGRQTRTPRNRKH